MPITENCKILPLPPSPESGDCEQMADAYGWHYNVMQDHNPGLNSEDDAA